MNPPPESPGPARNPFEPPPIGSYGGGYSDPRLAPKASSEAVAALVCGLLAWGCFPLGFLAIWLGVRARRASRENPAYVGGENLALAGIIVGGIFAAIGVLMMLLYLGMIVFALIGGHAFK